MHGDGSPNRPGRLPGGAPVAGFKSGRTVIPWPAACLGREVTEIGSTGLAEMRIFHIASAK
jgi:hypothetical protein